MANSDLTLSDLADLIKSNKFELSEKIENLHHLVDVKFSTSFNEVKQDIAAITQRQDILENKFERYERQLHLNDLLLNGIPKVQDEDLEQIFNTICTKVKYTARQDLTVPQIFRCKNRSDKPTIILKFISPTARNKFYKLFVEAAKKQPIVLADIGLGSNERIFLQESLSHLNSTIFRKAMEIKKEQRIYSVFTQNGLVRIKCSADAKPTLISNIQQLLEIEHQSKSASSQYKRKLNNSSITDEIHYVTENDPKVHKSSTPNDHRFIHSSISSASRSDSPNTTIIAQQQTRLRKSSSSSTGTLDGYFHRT